MKPAKSRLRVKLHEPQAHVGTANIRVNDPLAIGIEELKQRPSVRGQGRSFIKPENERRQNKMKTTFCQQEMK